MKPIKAWALIPKHINGGIYAYWTFDKKSDVSDPILFHRQRASCDAALIGCKFIRVEIRPIQPQKKRG